LLERAEQAKAELAALNGRRCETCKLPTWYENSIYGHCIHVSHIDPDFCCNRWTEHPATATGVGEAWAARAEEGAGNED
jgi:hypothetical protein